jgi:glycerol-3-phosphate acyltransferase PlsX
MLIALDAMGGDRGVSETVRAAVEAVQTLGVEVALVGPPETLGTELQRARAQAAKISIVPAEDSIGMGESPLQAVRRKRTSSIVVGLDLVKNGRAAAFVSAGNTGAVMAAATLRLGRIAGVERPALGGVFPARSGRRVLLLDVGASADCRAGQLVQFAGLGQAYVRQTLGIARPRVGLVSIGEEDSKGNQLVIEANARLRSAAGINFMGNVEGRDLASGAVDVAVTDGFTGNVILKTVEGTADFITRELREALTTRLQYRLAALFLRPAFASFRKRLDYTEYGGAPLLGVRGIVIIAHGRSDAHTIANAIRVARDGALSGVLADMGAAVE